jgi:hypothetical protein
VTDYRHIICVIKKVRECAGCCWNGHLTARVAEMNEVVLEGLLVACCHSSPKQTWQARRSTNVYVKLIKSGLMS